MIKAKTLLILGAGASVPYGYPTGDTLREELCDPKKLRGIQNSINETGLNLFCNSFKGSQLFSIDAFLAKRGEDKLRNGNCSYEKNFADIGKLAIANQLISREDLSKLLDPGDDHWLQYLWNHMSDVSHSEFKGNELKIISFNYDRVIEQYLQTAIEHSYGLEQTESLELRKSIEIVHVYGNLQELDVRPYGTIPTFLDPVAECIKVIPEARADNDTQFTKAKELINWAEKICFIGFGFDDTNVRRLGFPNHDLSKKAVFSTFYGKTSPELFKAVRSIGWIIGPNKRGSLEQTSDFKTLEYLRKTGFFIAT